MPMNGDEQMALVAFVMTLLALAGAGVWFAGRFIYRRLSALNPFSALNRLARARKELDEKLACFTEVGRRLNRVPLCDKHQLLRYINSLGSKNHAQLIEKLFQERESDSYADWLLGNPESLRRNLKRDLLKEIWYEGPWSYDSFLERLCGERNYWESQSNCLRLECSDLQVKIEELEQRIAGKKAVKPDDASPDIDDKRAQLQRVRVEITEKRLQEEKLEKEILDEQDQPLPHRRAGGVPTDQ